MSNTGQTQSDIRSSFVRDGFEAPSAAEIKRAVRWASTNAALSLASSAEDRDNFLSGLLIQKRKLWEEVARLTRAQNDGGMRSESRTYDGNGNLVRVQVSTKDVNPSIVSTIDKLTRIEQLIGSLRGFTEFVDRDKVTEVEIVNELDYFTDPEDAKVKKDGK